MVTVDADDALTAALRSLLAQPIRLLLGRAEGVGALSQRDQLHPLAGAIGEADHALPAGKLVRLRKRLLVRSSLLREFKNLESTFG